jgi:hypothetical protein
LLKEDDDDTVNADKAEKKTAKKKSK